MDYSMVSDFRGYYTDPFLHSLQVTRVAGGGARFSSAFEPDV